MRGTAHFLELPQVFFFTVLQFTVYIVKNYYCIILVKNRYLPNVGLPST